MGSHHQKREKEDTKFKLVAETLTLCVNNCGNPATNNICHKCFNSGIPILPKPSQSISQTSTSSATALSHNHNPNHNHVRDLKRPHRTSTSPPAAAAQSTPAKPEVNRCSGCHRKVGLTGFRCRCGELFCSDHRYSDRHDCTYDYKAIGRQAIARDNPLVKAPKILKL